MPDTERRQGEKGARYQSVPLQFMAELNEVERGERQCHSTGRGPADSRVSHLADPFRRSSNLQLEMLQTPLSSTSLYSNAVRVPAPLFSSVQFVVSEPEHVLVVHSKKVRKGRNWSGGVPPFLPPAPGQRDGLH